MPLVVMMVVLSSVFGSSPSIGAYVFFSMISARHARCGTPVTATRNLLWHALECAECRSGPSPRIAPEPEPRRSPQKRGISSERCSGSDFVDEHDVPASVSQPLELIEHAAEGHDSQPDAIETIDVAGQAYSLPQGARPYQRAALAAYAARLQDPAGQLLMACGTGKTSMGLWMAEVAHLGTDARCFLLLFPNLLLVAQTLRVWQQKSRLDFRALAVCSRLDAHDAAEEIRPTTDPMTVADFLQREHCVHVVFGTYQSARILGQAQGLLRQRGAILNLSFHWAFFDEAHRTASKGAQFSFALSNAHVRIRQRIFATATPRHTTLAGARSMADASIYGPVWYQYPLRQAVADAWIVPYKLVVLMVDTTSDHACRLQEAAELVRYWARTGTPGAIAGEGPQGRDVTARELSFMAALGVAMEQYGVRRCIAFHNKNEHAKRFQKWAQEVYPAMGVDIVVDRVDGTKMKMSERQAILGLLRDDRKRIVACARTLQEGVDFPQVAMAALAEPRRSVIDVAQLTGRVTRPCEEEGKNAGYIVIPVCIDPASAEEWAGQDADPESFSQADKEFAPVVDILKKLMASNSFLAGGLQRAHQSQAEAGGAEAWSPPWEVPLFGTFWPGIIGRDVDPQRVWRLIQTKLVHLGADPWEERLSQLRAYKDAHGGSTAVTRNDAEHPQLGEWLNRQRQAFREGSLQPWPERIAKLNELGVEWDLRAAQWNEQFATLQAHLAPHRHGHAPDPAEGDLLNWMQRQRHRFKDGTLDAERAQRLVAVGFVWDQRQRAWLSKLQELQEYKAQKGNCNVPRRSAAHRQLGVWLRKSAHELALHVAGQEGKLEDWQEQRLQSLGVEPSLDERQSGVSSAN